VCVCDLRISKRSGLGLIWAVALQTKQDRHCTYKRNIEAFLRNQSCLGKAISIIYSECVSLALVIQHAKRMHLLYCHLWPVCLYRIFPQYLIHGIIFGKKVIEHNMRVFSFSTVFIWNISYSKKNSARIQSQWSPETHLLPVHSAWETSARKTSVSFCDRPLRLWAPSVRTIFCTLIFLSQLHELWS
jgi:hypothetical protein